MPDPVGPVTSSIPAGHARNPGQRGAVPFLIAERRERKRLALLHELGLVENADDDVLAMHPRQNGDAEIDVALPAPQPETAVLRNPVLGDVEIGHDLDARDKRGLIGGVEGTQRAHEHAIDAEIDRHAIGAGMDMNVARLLLQSGADRLVDEPYDRSRIAAEGFEIDDFAAALPGFANERQPELGRDIFKDFVAVVAFLEQLLDCARRG